MTKGERVASGDRIGKTIIFAKNNNHAEYIAERFNVNYPQYKGELARVITFKTEYAQSLIDDFSKKDSAPHIAISVDMLDTGIDVPEVVNLVFFKMVRSKTKFWQMVGRGTRLCPDLYGPGKDKKFFNIFDFCQNLEYFNQDDIPQSGGVTSDSLDAKLFKGRVDLITCIDGLKNFDSYAGERDLRLDSSDYLCQVVAGMTFDNVIVRPKRRFVEKYSKIESWKTIGAVEAAEICNELASLPSQFQDDQEEAKRFDLMILKSQLCLLNNDKSFDKYRKWIVSIASALELQSNIPSIAKEMLLIQSLSTDEWWQDVNVTMLEQVRKKLRLLIRLLEKSQRPIIFTDFDDSIQGAETIQLKIQTTGLDYERFKSKTRDFLKAHQDKLAVRKLRSNKAVTQMDLEELEKILLDQAAGDKQLVEKAKEQAGGLGLFVRSLVGLDQGAATEALAEFLNDRAATANQLEFIGLLVESLTVDGAISRARLYGPPFTDLAATGPNSLFGNSKVEQLFKTIDDIRMKAVA